MNPFTIENVRAVFPGEGTEAVSLRIARGKVAAIGNQVRQPGDAVVDGRGRMLTPGLVDIHVHGIMQYSFDAGPDALTAAAGCFARFGTTTVLPTLVPLRGETELNARSIRQALNRLDALAGALERAEGVKMPGFHLEGPFLALPGAGCAVLPGDLCLLDDLLAACRRRVQAMSLSPDTADIIPVIERLCERGIVPFVTHTRATREQSQRAIAAGARHATHFYDVFPLPPENDGGVRPAGAVETYLADPYATVDFIADGCHVDPVAIQLAVRVKTCAGVAVITDANTGAGLPPGEYPTPWGYKIRVRPGNGARIADADHPKKGVLSGSALTMNAAMANVRRWIDGPDAEIWSMGTRTPARIAGLPAAVGPAVGHDADAVLWNDDLTPAVTWLRGREVWNESGTG